LLQSKLPVVSGSTGVDFPQTLDADLKKAGAKWILARNFSLGMVLAHKAITLLSRANDVFGDRAQFTIHEVHHTKKLDAPSGTAKAWAEWLAKPTEITWERKGDVVGLHQLSVSTGSEVITLTHQALDRKLFAEGALWAAKKIINDLSINPGLHPFEALVLKDLP
jgi:4-hydroxy-tetrahydrodipicolinate reductase